MCGKINERAVNTAPSINSGSLKANETQRCAAPPKGSVGTTVKGRGTLQSLTAVHGRFV
jgi:hypothetical protein